MHIKGSKLKFSAGSEMLSAVSLLPSSSSAHHIFSFHGAGSSSKDRALYLLNDLVRSSGLGALLFDFSGHGQSTGLFTELSLRKREEQAYAAIERFGTKPIVLIGSSMGADTALRMLEHHTPSTLILFAPALYSDAAYSVPFAEGFSKIIREPSSWKHASKILKLLANYTGRLLVVIGEDDTVIPPGVIELIDTTATRVSKKEIIRIPDCDHMIHAYLQSHDDVRAHVLDTMFSFVSDP